MTSESGSRPVGYSRRGSGLRDHAVRAHVGDRLIVGHDPPRVGLVIGVTNAGGGPPYVIKWVSDGHIAMIFPDPYSRIIPAG